MLKKLIITFACILTCIACSPPNSVATVVVTPETQPEPLEKVSWSIDIPKDWTKSVQPDPTQLHDVRRVLIASKTFKTEEGEGTLVLQVNVGRITKEETENFGEDLLEIETERANVKVLDVRAAKLGQTPGFRLIEIRQLDPKTLAVLAMKGGAKNNVGVLATCGTPVQNADELMPVCMKLLDTLVVK